MANSYKNIVITPNIGNTADPKIQFSGGNSSVNTDISVYMYPNSNGTLSFEGTAGQLFSVTNDLSNLVFSVADVSGIPSIEAYANGLISLAQYSGNVGIGNTSPTDRLSVNGTGYFGANLTAAADVSVTGNVTATSVYTSNWFRSTGSSGWYSQTYGGGFYMSDTSWLRTYNNKGLRVGGTAGTVAVSTDTSQLQVFNGSGTGDNDVAAISFLCTGIYGTKMHLRSDGYFGIGGWSAAQWRWYVNLGNGDMTAAGNVTAYSDIRLKENISKLENALGKIKKLNGVKFNWKDMPDVVGNPGKADFGILAHEVEEVAPELISPSAHKSPDGDPYKTVAYDKLVPLLIEAIKDLSSQVDDLKEQVKELKG